MSTDIPIWQQAFVKGFKLSFYNENLYRNILGFYEGKQVEIMIREKRQKVSTEAHAYYRGVVIAACQNTEDFGGWDPEKIHGFFADMFLKDIETVEVKGSIHFITKILSTSKISKKQMAEFIDNVRNWCAENNIIVPDPQPKK